MFFLLRLAFWLGLVALLVPLAFKGAGGENVSMFDALGAAQAVVSDARGFCARQPDACAVGGQMLSHLAESAQAGAKWLSEALNSAQTSGTGSHPTAEGTAGTPGLTPQDLEPRWGSGEKVQPAAPAAPPSGKQPS